MTSTLSLRHSWPWWCKGLAAGKKKETKQALTSLLIHLSSLGPLIHLNAHAHTNTDIQTLGNRKTTVQSPGKPSVIRQSVSCPAVYLITTMARVTTLPVLCGQFTARLVLHKTWQSEPAPQFSKSWPMSCSFSHLVHKHANATQVTLCCKNKISVNQG